MSGLVPGGTAPQDKMKKGKNGPQFSRAQFLEMMQQLPGQQYPPVQVIGGNG